MLWLIAAIIVAGIVLIVVQVVHPLAAIGIVVAAIVVAVAVADRRGHDADAIGRAMADGKGAAPATDRRYEIHSDGGPR